VQYKCTGIYNSGAESGIYYKDQELGIEWPLTDVVVSDKDAQAQSLQQWLASPLSDNVVYQPKAAFAGGVN
jgi:dTDP-4-dehydrorhamnose 3,5-epimerase